MIQFDIVMGQCQDYLSLYSNGIFKNFSSDNQKRKQIFVRAGERICVVLSGKSYHVSE